MKKKPPKTKSYGLSFCDNHLQRMGLNFDLKTSKFPLQTGAVWLNSDSWVFNKWGKITSFKELVFDLVRVTCLLYKGWGRVSLQGKKRLDHQCEKAVIQEERIDHFGQHFLPSFLVRVLCCVKSAAAAERIDRFWEKSVYKGV